MDLPPIRFTEEQFNQLVKLNKKIENNISEHVLKNIFYFMNWEVKKEITREAYYIKNLENLSENYLTSMQNKPEKIEKIAFSNFHIFKSAVQKVIEIVGKAFPNSNTIVLETPEIQIEESDKYFSRDHGLDEMPNEEIFNYEGSTYEEQYTQTNLSQGSALHLMFRDHLVFNGEVYDPRNQPLDSSWDDEFDSLEISAESSEEPDNENLSEKNIPAG